MQLEQRFTIPVDIDQAWDLLLDIERSMSCFPGAVITHVDDELIEGGVKVKLGPVMLTYKGTAKFLERDASTHKVRLEGHGSDGKGGSTAAVTVEAVLAAVDESTTECVIQTDLDITGRPAQFGRGMMVDVGNKITKQFASNLSAMLMKVDELDSQPQDNSMSHSIGTANTEPLDLVASMRGAALKRILPIVGAALIVVILLRIKRRTK